MKAMKDILRIIFVTLIFMGGIFSLPVASNAAGDDHAAPALPKLEWGFKGITGTYDRGALQRGFQIYRESCSACHSMNLVHYRNLAALGYSEEEVKAIASSYTVTDGPNDEGEMFERPALPRDAFVAPFPNAEMAAYANGGLYPPDMSMLAKARYGGADYIYGILTGYEDPPHDAELPPGKSWNKYISGHIIAMGQPLYEEQVTYEDGSPETVEQYARDVSEFLTWASEPHMEARKQTGIKAFLFLFVFALVMYGVKRRVWADAH